MIAKTAAVVEAANPPLAAMMREKLPRVRHQMWNGRWTKAISRMRSIFIAAGKIADELAAAGKERVQRLRNHLLDLRNYLLSNQRGLTNYAHAYRHGLRISSAPAESGMNHLVNQRMGKTSTYAMVRRRSTPPAASAVCPGRRAFGKSVSRTISDVQGIGAGYVSGSFVTVHPMFEPHPHTVDRISNCRSGP
jgi:hypothetical protein